MASMPFYVFDVAGTVDGRGGNPLQVDRDRWFLDGAAVLIPPHNVQDIMPWTVWLVNLIPMVSNGF